MRGMITAALTTPLQQARPFEKWGVAAVPGWQPLPDVLLHNQAKLGLTATDMLVLANVLSHWWYADEKPFPRVTTIARRMDVTSRTVQRSLQKLSDKGFLQRRKATSRDGTEREVLDPTGLVNALGKLAIRDPSYRYKTRKLQEDRGGTLEAPF